MTAGAVVGIGGGGFLQDDTRGLQERYLLAQCRAARPRVLYLGTAAGDGERAQLRCYQLFTRLGCEVETLPFFPFEMRRDYGAQARAADLIYVGGGNTVAMLAVWCEFGFDRALEAAWRGGTVLAGVSAGANCWFAQYVTDSVPGGGLRAGLGWLPGTFCPHLDGEPWRQPLLDGAPQLPAWGAPDGVMLRFDGQAGFVEAVSSRPGVAAVVRWPGDAQPMPLPTRLLD